MFQDGRTHQDDVARLHVEYEIQFGADRLIAFLIDIAKVLYQHPAVLSVGATAMRVDVQVCDQDHQTPDG